jgi:excisionase family DNA binding protein
VTAELKPLALRPNAAAAALGVGRDKLFALLANGSIRSFREGNSRLIPVAAIEEYLHRRLQEEANA